MSFRISSVLIPSLLFMLRSPTGARREGEKNKADTEQMKHGTDDVINTHRKHKLGLSNQSDPANLQDESQAFFNLSSR